MPKPTPTQFDSTSCKVSIEYTNIESPKLSFLFENIDNPDNIAIYNRIGFELINSKYRLSYFNSLLAKIQNPKDMLIIQDEIAKMYNQEDKVHVKATEVWTKFGRQN